MFLIPAAVGSKLIIRFTVTSQFTRPEDIHRDWNIIQRTANEILQPGRWPRPHALSLDSENEAETLWQEQEVETQHEPSIIDKHLVRQNQRRATRSMSCSAELPPTRQDSAHTVREAPPLGVLAKIPESPERRRNSQKRLTKFHSMPSFPQVWGQCSIQQFYWPFNTANCFNCFTHSHTHTQPTK
ncbi:Histidine decarboxylase [Bagarius yarrelli]|uniref:Histidine decarboxylase n=1 Tax=Bagarius yarrelli TaxID=175774 RepID=A0A556VUC5_BAGYA|nr:Histidine decarboxylase [Bagarius yarrelli]